MPAPALSTPVDSFEDQLGNMIVPGVLPPKPESGDSTPIAEGSSAPSSVRQLEEDQILVHSGPSSVENGDMGMMKPHYEDEKALRTFRMPDFHQHLKSRDSLRDGQQDMGEILDQMDDNYKVMEQTAEEDPDANLPPLLKAAKNGDVDEIQYLLSEPGTDILRRDTVYGQTALHFAIRAGHLRVVHALCDPTIVRSIIDAADNRRNTPLHLAAVKSRRITKMLLEANAEVNVVNMNGHTPLSTHIFLAKNDDPVMTELLLHSKADPNMPVDQTTILHMAIDSNMLDIACRLVRHGARLDGKDENGKMVFDKVNQHVLRKLLAKVSHPPVWIRDEERTNCMLCSKKFGLTTRKHHCRHCGRICCKNCAKATVDSSKFPKSFRSARARNGSKPHEQKKRVCKTCVGVLKERERPKPQSNDEAAEEQRISDRLMNISMDKVPQHANAPAS